MCAEFQEPSPKIIVRVVPMISRELQGVDTGIICERPGKPALRVNFLDSVSMRTTAYRQEEQLLCTWTEGKCTIGSGME